MHSSLQLPLLLLGLPLVSGSPVGGNIGPVSMQDIGNLRVGEVVDPIERRAAGDFNDLGGPCKAVTILFAKGTTETGLAGTLAGPPFFDAVSQQMGAGNVAVQGIDYAADVQGFVAGGDKKGSALMATSTKKALSSCPESKVIMSGYSQGGQLVHNAATMLSPAEQQQVAGVVIFGDPLNGKAVGSIPASKTKIICHNGDNICEGGSQIRQAHLTYRNDAGAAAQFVATMAKSAAGAAPKPAGAPDAAPAPTAPPKPAGSAPPKPAGTGAAKPQPSGL
ncbi:hypothetical protein HYALB_00010434 [Hymenoscyphus albidus]|uniref:Cutinase n=1 Tax=Hymenoscyphus albidus TaxID=595503 RepID=A0A9N9LRE3_9HELO|nr:hypothetical protein HYALB_00010434 [Hymenoscyphus albidus]